MAEQAESIDNPMHEAAKRGMNIKHFRVFISLLFYFILILLFLKLLHNFRQTCHVLALVFGMKQAI